jgi:sec-independent protein translocase protein TatC
MANRLFSRNSNSTQSEMTFIDHLEELRWHIMRSILAILFFAIFIFIKMDWVFSNIIAGPIQNDFISYRGLCALSHKLGIGDALCMPPMSVQLQTTAFGAQFTGSINIALWGGFIAAFPYIFWEFWRFAKPALKPTELKYTRGIIFWVSLCFFIGAAFGYFLLAPFTFNFLANYNIGVGSIIETKPTLTDYLENLTNLILGCSIAFELPVVAYLLTKIGILTPSLLRTYRKYAIVVILVVAAIITPSPDWMSQMLVFTPLWLLYEISIAISAKVHKAEIKKEEEWS